MQQAIDDWEAKPALRVAGVTPPPWLHRLMGVFSPSIQNVCANYAMPLQSDWRGCSYAHPPDGEPPQLWVGKAAETVESGVGKEVLLLTRAATDTHWFASLCARANGLCFIHGRLRFSGQRRDAPYPSVLAYFGPRSAEFADQFAEYGEVIQLKKAKRQRARPIRSAAVFSGPIGSACLLVCVLVAAVLLGLLCLSIIGPW